MALTGKLRTELSGILNYALAGYRRLRKRGHFVMPKSSIDSIEHIELLGAPVKAFIQACCNIGSGLTVTVKDLWNAYELHSQSEGRKDYGSKEWFGRNLRSAAPGITMSKKGPKASRELAYVGIALNPVAEKKKENPFAQHGLEASKR